MGTLLWYDLGVSAHAPPTSVCCHEMQERHPSWTLSMVFFSLHFAYYKLIPGLHYRVTRDEWGSSVLPCTARRRENKFVRSRSSIMMLAEARP